MRPYLIAVAGPSGSGKTTVAHLLAAQLQAPVINLDSYYHDLAHEPMHVRERTNFDHPESLEEELLVHHLDAIKRGEKVRIPVYDFAVHSRVPGAFTEITPGSFLIVEGLFLLHWRQVRERFDLCVYVNVEDAICFTRRLARDIAERGRTPESVERQYAMTVRPMMQEFIAPSKQHANIVIDGTSPVAQSVQHILSHIPTKV
jgi:uridine kinase